MLRSLYKHWFDFWKCRNWRGHSQSRFCLLANILLFYPGSTSTTLKPCLHCAGYFSKQMFCCIWSKVLNEDKWSLKCFPKWKTNCFGVAEWTQRQPSLNVALCVLETKITIKPFLQVFFLSMMFSLILILPPLNFHYVLKR